MEQIHIRFDYDEAKEHRKNILGAELDLINMIRSAKEYHRLRKQSMSVKSKIRTETRKLIKDTNTLLSHLPKQEKKKEPRAVERVIVEREKKGRIEDELRSIKAKLDKLNF